MNLEALTKSASKRVLNLLEPINLIV